MTLLEPLSNIIHNTRRGYFSEILLVKYLSFYHKNLQFSAQNRKTRDFEKKISIRNMAEIALAPRKHLSS